MKLNARRRDALPAKDFALPKTRQYPVEDRRHAADAKARADTELEAGKLSHAEYETVIRRANRKLGK